ncbi:MAG TPA: ATP-binding protein [Steroidobacteraceae bacterium]|nr:ATP-binding protein [Steroidobacteraceae bacterium]
MNPQPATPRKQPLATWLSAASLLITFAALAAMALTSTLVVNRFAQRQGLARSELAVSLAREYLRQVNQDNLATARALAANPAVQRLAAAPGSAEAAARVLRENCGPPRESGCLLATPRQLLGAAGTSAPWAELAAAHARQGERFALAPHDGSAVLLGAAYPVPGGNEAAVIVLQALDADLLREAARQSGATIGLQNLNSYRAPDADPLTPLHTAALGNGDHAAARVRALDRYEASAVLRDAAGTPIALLDAQIPAAEFDRPAALYRHAVILVGLALAALAGIAGLLAGRWLAAPVVRLAAMARRIGQGDFSPAVPTVVPRELDLLAHAMDDMRQNLIELTSRLRRREAEAQAVLAGVVEGVFVTDTNRHIMYANAQFVRSVPGAEGGVLGRFCGDVLHQNLPPAERPCERDCPILAARRHGAARGAETLRMADGATRSVIVVSAAPAEGRQVQLLRDETDLEAARRARDSVLGNISHEFRTPLAAQLAAVEMLRDGLGKLGEAEQRELLTNVERGVLRLMRLIDNLLESVRIESGQLGIRQQRIELEAVVGEAVELLAPLLSQSMLRVSVDLAPLRGRVLLGDAQRLQQVFVNLLSNAAKYAPAGSRIDVGASAGEAAAEIWVEDSGPGPPAGDPQRLFERFRRGGHPEPEAPGLGLGLWIVRSIVERHAGSVRVERTAGGRTRFVLRLPLAAGPAAIVGAP